MLQSTSLIAITIIATSMLSNIYNYSNYCATVTTNTCVTIPTMNIYC